MTTKSKHNWLTLAALKAQALSFKEGDYQMLSDRILVGALDYADRLQTALARPLRHSELKALESSPLTQLRLAQLNAQRRIQGQAQQGSGAVLSFPAQQRPSLPSAANDPIAWGKLRVAGEQAGQRTSSQSECGLWTLSFQADAQQQWTVLLKLHDEALLDALAHADAPVEYAVRDARGNTLLLGNLDTYGELRDFWDFPDAPAAHFNRHGLQDHDWEVVQI